MKEFTCIECGAKGIDNGKSLPRKFCSKECSREYWRKQKLSSGSKVPSCQFNLGVACVAQECENCGWNPAVEEKRKAVFA